MLLAVVVASCSVPDADSAADPSPSPSSSTVDVVTAAPSDTSIEPVPSEFVTAMQIVLFFQDTGLVIDDPRDNTDNGWCGADMWDCDEFLTSEQVSIVILPSAEGAARMSAGGDVYVSDDGQVALSFTAQRTPAEQQEQYTRALEDYLLQVAAQR
jgi:hypothetical protein